MRRLNDLATAVCGGVLLASGLFAQSPAEAAPNPQPPALATPPIAIVPLDSSIGGAAMSVSGSMQAWNGRAFLTGSGSITAGVGTAEVALPYRGTLRICTSTTVNLATDTSAPADDASPAARQPSAGLRGLLMAIDHGAVEMSFAATPPESNADVLMTPDFRILISGPGTSDVKVRLGNGGDTCVDNSGKDAPYVVVTSLFESGLYRVQSGQRIMLQHGSLHEVVDHEKEPCGCPPPASTALDGNEFPLAQSEGLAPMPPVKQSDVAAQDLPSPPANVVPPLVATGRPEQQTAAAAPPETASQPAEKPKKKPGAFARLGHFFRRIFGAE